MCCRLLRLNICFDWETFQEHVSWQPITAEYVPENVFWHYMVLDNAEVPNTLLLLVNPGWLLAQAPHAEFESAD